MKHIKRHPELPSFVRVNIPHTREDVSQIQKDIQVRLDNWIAKYGPWHKKKDVKITIKSERRRSYEGTFYAEQHITYNGEKGKTIPAYLLIPEVGKSKLPAVVANHQCNVDCDLGKDAVVGKSYNRSDQAYGFELMRNGFVVLAPDSINCGERAIAGLKGPECSKDKCWQAAIPFLSVTSFYLKHIWDATRAVDVLCSLDCVDSSRIGMIGHSLGAGTSFWTAVVDTRVRASVLSCHFLGGLGGSPWYQAYGEDQGGIYYHELLALIAPRAVLATRGRRKEKLLKFCLNSSRSELAVMQWAFEYAKLFCTLQDVPESHMRCRFFNGAHEFPESERNFAYQWLKKHLM